MAWTAPRTWVTGEIVTAAIGNTHWRDNMVATGEPPWLIDVDPFSTAVTNTNWSAITVATVQIKNGYRESTGAQNAEVGWDIIIPNGTWTVEVVTRQLPDAGIFTVLFDGVSKGTVDSYSAGDTVNSRLSVTGIVVATTAKTRVLLRMATKNAAASSYFGRISGVRLLRTA